MKRAFSTLGLAATLAVPVVAQDVAADSALTDRIVTAAMNHTIVSPYVGSQRDMLGGVELRVFVADRTYTVQVLRTPQRQQLVFFAESPTAIYTDFAADGVPDVVVAPCADKICVPVRYLKPDLPDSLVPLPDSTVRQTYSLALHSLADALRVR